MYITATPEAISQGGDAVRLSIIEQVREQAISEGVTPEFAEKLVNAFYGPTAPCALRTGKMHFASVNRVAGEEGAILDRISGSLLVTPAGGEDYEITLDDTVPQHMFLVAIERFGNVTKATRESSKFWSYTLVIPETTGECQALALALDCGNNDEELSFNFSRRLYFRPIPGAGGRTRNENRLAGLKGTANIESICLMVAAKSEFPIEETRINRPSREQRLANWQENRQRGMAGRPATQTVAVGAGVGAGTDEEDLTDPFATSQS